MKAIRVHQFGGPEVQLLEENVPIPEPSGSQILVRVKAVGVNPIDTYLRAGLFEFPPKLPFTPGFDAAGIVEKIGADVKRFKTGDRVFICGTLTGSYAEFTLVAESRTFELPDNLTFEQGAALGVPYLTAYRTMYQLSHLKPDSSLFIHGASGAVGLACIQLARSHGVKLIVGTAGTDEAIELLSNESMCGPGNVYNHRDPEYFDKLKSRFPKGFDLIVEVLADVNLARDVELIARAGDIMVVGSRGLSNNVSTQRVLMTECRIIGVLLLTASDQQYGEAAQDVIEKIREGLISPIISFRFPLEKAAEAHIQMLADSKKPGKIVLTL